MSTNKLKAKHTAVTLLDLTVKLSRLNGLSLSCYVKRHRDLYLMKINTSISKKKQPRFVMRCCPSLSLAKCLCFCDGQNNLHILNLSHCLFFLRS